MCTCARKVKFAFNSGEFLQTLKLKLIILYNVFVGIIASNFNIGVEAITTLSVMHEYFIWN